MLFEHSEILRVIESLHLTEKYKVATPVDWKVCIYGSIYYFKTINTHMFKKCLTLVS